MSPEHVAKYVAESIDAFLEHSSTTAGWNTLLGQLEEWFRTLDDSKAFFGMLLLLQRRAR